MKKRLLVLPLFIILLVTIISAPSYYYENNNIGNKLIDKKGFETTRTFLIKNDQGPDFYRTYNGFNKGDINSNNRYVGFNHKGTYRNFDDSNSQPKGHNCYTNCPSGWECTKKSTK